MGGVFVAMVDAAYGAVKYEILSKTLFSRADIRDRCDGRGPDVIHYRRPIYTTHHGCHSGEKGCGMWVCF